MWAMRFLEGAQYSRAERHLRSTEDELAAFTDEDAGGTEIAIARKLVEHSRAALTQGKVEECWHLLNGARRILAAVGTPDDRMNAGLVLRIEAEKLSKWRREGINVLLKTPGGPPEPRALAAALLLRDEFYENRYHRIAMQREQMKVLLVIATLALLVILLVAATATSPLDELTPWDARILTMVLMFGILGASFSAARTNTIDSLKTLIPELMQSKSIAMTRTVLGACPGLAAYAFLQSKLVDLGSITMAKALALAFVSGFSERLVVKVVETVAGRDEAGKGEAGKGEAAR